MEKDSAVMQNTNYKLLDLRKFICAFLVIGIHTRPLQAVSDVADKLFYYDISNYAVPFFYACTGYLLIVRQQNKGVHEKNTLSDKEGFATICDLVDYLSASDILRMDYRGK